MRRAGGRGRQARCHDVEHAGQEDGGHGARHQLHAGARRRLQRAHHQRHLIHVQRQQEGARKVAVRHRLLHRLRRDVLAQLKGVKHQRVVAAVHHEALRARHRKGAAGGRELQRLGADLQHDAALGRQLAALHARQRVCLPTPRGAVVAVVFIHLERGQRARLAHALAAQLVQHAVKGAVVRQLPLAQQQARRDGVQAHKLGAPARQHALAVCGVCDGGEALAGGGSLGGAGVVVAAAAGGVPAAVDGRHLHAALHVPEVQVAIQRGSAQLAAVGAEGDGEGVGGVAERLGGGAGAVYVPQLHRLVPRRARQQASGAIVGEGADGCRVPRQHV